MRMRVRVPAVSQRNRSFLEGIGHRSHLLFVVEKFKPQLPPDYGNGCHQVFGKSWLISKTILNHQEDEYGSMRLAFGPFQIDCTDDKQELLFSGQPLDLPLTACLKILTALVQGRGRLVSKNDLMNAGWGETAVEDINLSVAISTLRKELDPRLRDTLRTERSCIKTVHRRGFRFMLPVTDVTDAATENDAANANATAREEPRTQADAPDMPRSGQPAGTAENKPNLTLYYHKRLASVGTSGGECHPKERRLVQWWGFREHFMKQGITVGVVVRKVGNGKLYFWSVMLYTNSNPVTPNVAASKADEAPPGEASRTLSPHGADAPTIPG
jgi:DNA-binding winged helix-turn-helix (wHTH) protein